jgi:GTP-binding protein
MGDERHPFVIADLPGLIAGAAQGAGLGIQFLKHVERCRVLVHLVDLSAEGDDAAADLEVVERELAAFSPELLRRERILVGSKLDAARPERQASLRGAAAARGLPYREISAVSGRGVPQLVESIARSVEGRSQA